MSQSHSLPDFAPLSEEQRRTWVNMVGGQLASDWAHKYLKGEQEHASDLGSVSIHQLLTELYQEHLDAIAYIAEVKRRMRLSHAVMVEIKLVRDVIDSMSHHSFTSESDLAIVHQLKSILNQQYGPIAT